MRWKANETYSMHSACAGEIALARKPGTKELAG
jgi:hypothetical protein